MNVSCTCTYAFILWTRKIQCLVRGHFCFKFPLICLPTTIPIHHHSVVLEVVLLELPTSTGWPQHTPEFGLLTGVSLIGDLFLGLAVPTLDPLVLIHCCTDWTFSAPRLNRKHLRSSLAIYVWNVMHIICTRETEATEAVVWTCHVLVHMRSYFGPGKFSVWSVAIFASSFPWSVYPPPSPYTTTLWYWRWCFWNSHLYV